MKKPHQPLPARHSIRLENYDYSSEGAYFLTLCTHNKQHLFGTIKNATMCLNKAGSITLQQWERTPIIRPNTSLGAFMVMPNHVHMVLHIDVSMPSTLKSNHGTSQTVGAIVKGYKSAVTRQLRRELGFSSRKAIWQRNYHEHIK